MGFGCVCAKAVAIGLMGLALGVLDRQLRPMQLSLAPAAPTPPTGAGGPTGAPVSVTPTGATPAPATDPHAGEGMISLAEARAIYDSGEADWIDARTLDEYNADRIGQALHIAPDAFFGGKIPDAVGVLSRDRQLVVYCGGGACDASLLVALRLRELGFARVVVVKEGWNGWTAAGYPTANNPGGTGGGR